VATKTGRGEWIKLRVSSAEKALIEERAKAAGLKVSEYIRREAGIGHFGRADLRRVEQPSAAPTESAPVPERAGTGFEARVQEASRRMPRRNAEGLVRREMAREKARAALSCAG
jgi:hypothetical protein